MGLGYEVSSVTVPHLLSASDRTYVQLVRTLSPAGVIRIGGNTSDDASFSASGEAVSAPKGTVVNSESLRQLGGFLDATNWQLIWGLNLGSGAENQMLEEAAAVSASVKGKLLAFEIGNEPDLFGRGTKHRAREYSYDDYLKEFRQWKTALRAKVPNAPLAGPDAATARDWVTRFAADEGRDLKLLTHHYYRECAGPGSTLDKLLRPDPKLDPLMAALKAASSEAKVPYRICETNSFCGGGKPGVSDTFGAALWVLDFMFRLASASCGGVNIETGVNQLGFISSYSPIRQDEHGASFAAPEYYGMLAFAQASKGRLVSAHCESGDVNVSAYAVAGAGSSLTVTVINKDTSVDAHVSLSIPKQLGRGQVMRLSAPSLQSKKGITLSGSTVEADGRWEPNASEVVESRGGSASVRVPVGSAAILMWT